jgi:putative sigma-54 modulation protein
MNIEYTARRTTITPKLRAQTDAGLARIERVTNRCTSAHIVLTEDKYRKIADLEVKCRGDVLVAKCEATDMETALHDALAKLEQQAIRSKERYTTVRSHPKPIPQLSV